MKSIILNILIYGIAGVAIFAVSINQVFNEAGCALLLPEISDPDSLRANIWGDCIVTGADGAEYKAGDLTYGRNQP